MLGLCFFSCLTIDSKIILYRHPGTHGFRTLCLRCRERGTQGHKTWGYSTDQGEIWRWGLQRLHVAIPICSGSRLGTHRIVVTPLIARTLSLQWMKLHMVLSYTDPGDSVRGRGRLGTGYPDSSPLGAGLNWALSTLTL